MTPEPRVLRYTAFADDPEGGNPAGIVLDASGLDEPTMQRIAADVDYAETAFVTGTTDDGARTVRYFSPIAEVPFCGHATVATAIAIAEREGPGTLRFATPVGEIVIATDDDGNGLRASFTSVDTELAHFPEFVLDALLELVGVDRTQLDERYPPRLAFAGNRHPIIVIAEAHVFDDFGFDPVAGSSVMRPTGKRLRDSNRSTPFAASATRCSTVTVAGQSCASMNARIAPGSNPKSSNTCASAITMIGCQLPANARRGG